MKNRNIVAVLLLPMVTFGIYSLVWLISTKNELNKLGAKIPTALLLFIPIANLFWLWNYAEGVELATKGKLAKLTSFLLALFLGVIGYAIIQNEFNNLGAATDAGAVPMVSDPTVMTAVVVDQKVVAPSFVAETPVVETPSFTEQPAVEAPVVAEQPVIEIINQFQAAPISSDVYTQPVDSIPEMTTTEQVSNNNEA